MSHDKVKLRSDDANNYLKRHRIMELFNNLTAQLIYTRPDFFRWYIWRSAFIIIIIMFMFLDFFYNFHTEKPKTFLIETLEKLQMSRSTKSNYPCLFDETNIKSVFGMLDPTGRGYITLKQYEEAMLTLGAKDYNPTPPGFDEDRINLDTFKLEAIEGLKSASATFKD